MCINVTQLESNNNKDYKTRSLGIFFIHKTSTVKTENALPLWDNSLGYIIIFLL